MSWTIGAVRIAPIVELEAAIPPAQMLPDASPEQVLAIPWLRPHFIDADGNLLMHIQAFVVESQGKRIVVDTCLGNDKPRPGTDWDKLSGTFLEDLNDAGFPRESIDTVVCTHLHIDHVGWNTMLVDGTWQPTFPNARYLFGRAEWEYWREQHGEMEAQVMLDSVRPVFDAGLVDLVETDHPLTSEICLEPSPGHTPGHVSLRIHSQSESAVITGDLMHHPCQIAHPEWGVTAFDVDTAQAEATRREFIAARADDAALVIGTHFPTPTAGKILRYRNGYTLKT